MAFSTKNNTINSSDKDYLRSSLGTAAAQICQSLGWHSVHRTSHDILTDILERYLKQVSKTACNFSQHYSRTVPNLLDISSAFDHLGIVVHELEDYVNQVESNPSSINLPTLPVPSNQDLLSFEVDDQFPQIVNISPIEDIKVEPEETKENVEDDDHDTFIETDDVAARPKDLNIRKGSVDSPPYSPLEPKCLNLDALANMDLTRPGLVVTTPKGYTPTLCLQSQSIDIASVAETVTETSSSLATSGVIQTDVVLKDIALTKTNSPVNSTKTQSKIISENKIVTEVKITGKNKDEKKLKKSPKLTSLKSPPTKQNIRSPDILSPPRSGSHVKQKSPKKDVVPVANITDFVKISKIASPVQNTKLAKKEKLKEKHRKLDEKVMDKSCVKHEKKAQTNRLLPEIKLESPASPVQSLSNVLNSPPIVSKVEPPSPLSAVKIESDIETNQEKPTKTMFPGMNSDTEFLASSPTDPFCTSDLLSPTIRRAGYSSDAVKKNTSPGLMVQSKQNYSPSDNCGNLIEPEVDILSISQDEIKSPTRERGVLVSVTSSLHLSEEKKKKKKKKSDRDKNGGKEERREKKEKKKRLREEKERQEVKEKQDNKVREKKIDGIPKFTLQKLTLKMGKETISESSSKLVVHSETLENPESFLSPIGNVVDLTAKHSKKHKKENKRKEKDVKGGGFYVETLTNTSSAAAPSNAAVEDLYYCPGCSLPDDGSPMIGCDSCDLWYHWPCVGITAAPADDVQWFCPTCIGGPPAKKKKKRKKRD